MGPGSGGKVPLLPSLVVRLGPEWRYVASRKCFLSTGDEEWRPVQELPAGTRIEPMAPHLAESDPGQLTEDEKDLARYVQVIFPAGTDPGDYVTSIRDWPCAEKVRPPPDISLP